MARLLYARLLLPSPVPHDFISQMYNFILNASCKKTVGIHFRVDFHVTAEEDAINASQSKTDSYDNPKRV